MLLPQECLLIDISLALIKYNYKVYVWNPHMQMLLSGGGGTSSNFQ